MSALGTTAHLGQERHFPNTPRATRSSPLAPVKYLACPEKLTSRARGVVMEYKEKDRVPKYQTLMVDNGSNWHTRSGQFCSPLSVNYCTPCAGVADRSDVHPRWQDSWKGLMLLTTCSRLEGCNGSQRACAEHQKRGCDGGPHEWLRGREGPKTGSRARGMTQQRSAELALN